MSENNLEEETSPATNTVTNYLIHLLAYKPTDRNVFIIGSNTIMKKKSVS